MKSIVMIVAALCMWSVALAKDVNIVFMGNSITYGALLEDKKNDAPPATAVRYITAHMKDVDVHFRNCGVSGRTTVDFLPVTNKNFAASVAAAKELSANGGDMIFSISLGTNDSAQKGPFGAPVSPEQYYTNLQVIINALLEEFPNSKVVVQQPIWYSPNTYNKATYLKAGLERLQSYFPMIQKLVEHYSAKHPGHVYLGDTKGYEYFRDNYQTLFAPENGNAGTFYLHPSKEGAVVLGNFWAEAIMKAM